MKNPMIATLLTLTQQLGAEITKLEEDVESEQLRGDRLSERCADHERRIDELSDSITDARRRRFDAEDKLAGMNRASLADPFELSRLRQQSVLLLHILSNPTLCHDVMTFVHGEGAEMWDRGEKIPTIKRIREITACGLKEAKDFCETYPWAKPFCEGPVEDKATKDSNPCVDSSCLNGA